MGAFDEVERLLAVMNKGEKARLLQHVARDMADASPGIDSSPGICGGDPCIVRTRVPVWTLERARRLGITEAQLLSSYPMLRAEDLVNAWAYAAAHPIDIARQIRENEEA